MYLEEPDSGSVSDIEWLSRRIHVRKKNNSENSCALSAGLGLCSQSGVSETKPPPPSK